VSFTLNTDGTVSGVSILTTSGHEALDQAAVAAVLDAAPFPPPEAAVRLVIPVVFKLR
jgi:TonB family protein